MGSRRARAATSAILAAAVALAAAPAAAAEWIESGEDAGPTRNCVTGNFENLGSA